MSDYEITQEERAMDRLIGEKETLRADCVTWAQRAKDAEDALSRVTIERSKEGSALRAEVERLRDLHDANETETRRLIRERDEARASLAETTKRLHDFESSTIADVVQDLAAQKENVAGIAASLARVERERTHALETMNLAHKGRDEALAECARLRAEGERAGPLEKALRDAADALWAAWQMLSAINASEPSRDRNSAAMAASRAASAARHALDSANPVHSTWPAPDALRSPPPPPATGPAPEQRYCNKCGVLYIGPAEHAGCNYHAPIIHHHHNPAPRSSAEDAAPRCEACEAERQSEGLLGYRVVVGNDAHTCARGTGSSPSTGGGA